MKKWSLVICTVALLGGLFSACTGENPELSTDVNVGVIKGPSSIGMIKFMDESDRGEIDTNNFSFEIAASADEIVPKIVQGKIDIAAIPANLSSVLYNNTEGEIKVIAVSTLGMMYVVESGDTISGVEDLRGKTIFAAFKGNSPEYDLNYILDAYDMNPEKDLTIEWKSEHAESVAALTTNQNAVAILPQPFATVAQMSDENIRIAVDLNHEWEKLQETSDNPIALITGVVVARTAFIEQNPEAVFDFLDRYEASVEYTKNNVDEAAALVGKYNIFPEAVAKKAIPYCNMTFIEGLEMKENLTGYLSILFEQNPQSVGGVLPNDAFYFIR